ncbi:embryonic polyadenylate-binding protein 2 [Phaenicophaeus curvirostris]|uniref:embryonic polyadenylate-binding protein 2 n=1 Tax=Phaenicophaeus curvirostris TaxID=33595 RepID=UPI0037F0E1F0
MLLPLRQGHASGAGQWVRKIGEESPSLVGLCLAKRVTTPTPQSLLAGPGLEPAARGIPAGLAARGGARRSLAADAGCGRWAPRAAAQLVCGRWGSPGWSPARLRALGSLGWSPARLRALGLPGLQPSSAAGAGAPQGSVLNGCLLNDFLPLFLPSLLFLDTAENCWQDPPPLAAVEASWDVAEMAALWKATDDDSDLSNLEERDSEEELVVQDPELEAIKARVQEMEEKTEKPMELQLEDESCLIANSETVFFLKMEADQRSVYVGNVDYGGTAEELESHFNSCGGINRVTILCDKFSGHPKGYAYIEFEEKSSVTAAVALDGSVFRGRIIKVLPKRTNMPGLSTTDRGGHRRHFQARGGLAHWGGYYRGQQARMRGRMYRGRQRHLPWYFPY